jgi:hypothetical protein
MTAAKLNTFGGMFPRVPAALLPDNSAQAANNCDFAYGELRAIKAPFPLRSLVGTVGSLYTEDGLRFFSWPGDMDAVRSPVINDTFTRVYYTSGADFRVTTSTNMPINGGAPASSYRVGVPQPTVAPDLSLDDKAVLPASLGLTSTFFYESNGVKYQEGPITLEVVEDRKHYRFKLPDRKKATTETGGESLSTDEAITITGVAALGDNGSFSVASGFAPLKAKAVNRSQMTVVDPLHSGYPLGYVIDATYVQADDGAIHNVESLFTLTRYGRVDDGSAPSSSSTTTGSASTDGTPEAAFPALYLVGKDTDSNEEAFAGYSSNSSFAESTAKVKIILTQNKDDNTKYDVTLDFGSGASADDETRAYVYTFVNTYNEEGAPSPPAVVTAKTLNRVNVKATLPTNPDMAPIKLVRVYRSATGTDSDNFFLATEFPCLANPPGVVTIADDTKAGGLGEMLRSTYWLPPSTALRGLRNIGNGILLAWKGNEVWFSEAYRPHAWSPNNVLTFPHAIVAAEPAGTGAVVCTTAEPHLVSGVSPDGMSQTKIERAAGVRRQERHHDRLRRRRLRIARWARRRRVRAGDARHVGAILHAREVALAVRREPAVPAPRRIRRRAHRLLHRRRRAHVRHPLG